MTTGEPLPGIAAADALLGRPFPLPSLPLPLPRWVEVRACGASGAEVEWNLDDTRSGTPGRLAIYAGVDPPEEQLPPDAEQETLAAGGRTLLLRRAPLQHAQPSLRPVHELRWSVAGLELRITAQGPWEMEDLLAIVASIGR
jgi:hypothetical protein